MQLTSQNIQKIFTNIVFDDSKHKYYLKKDNELLPMISTTQMIHKFMVSFDKAIAEKVAKKFGMDEQTVLHCWDMFNKYAALSGSIVHNFNENFYRKIISNEITSNFEKEYHNLEKIEIIQKQKEELFVLEKNFPIKEHLMLGKSNPIGRIEILKGQFLNFFFRTKDVLIPIAVENIIADFDSLISGTFDILYFSKKTNLYHLGDYKTNKSFETNNLYIQNMVKYFEKYNFFEFDNNFEYDVLYEKIANNKNLPNFLIQTLDRFYLKKPFQHLMSSNEIIYSLQLTNYKKIMQKYFPDINFGNSFLITFSELKENWISISLNDYFEEINLMHKLINKKN